MIVYKTPVQSWDHNDVTLTFLDATTEGRC